MLLEKRVGVLESSLEMKDAQLGEVLAAAHLDPTTLQQVRVSSRATQMCISLPGCMLQCTMAQHCTLAWIACDVVSKVWTW